MSIINKILSIFSKMDPIDKHLKNFSENNPEVESEDLSGLTFGRNYSPEDSDIFYHYCSPDTFKAIVQTRTIRFSDVNMMNDYGEKSWGYDMFIEAANKILEMKDKVPALKDIDKDFIDHIDAIISSSQLFVHPVIACFSNNPDVLSQWRAYADNGRGFAVGFSGRVLKNMPVTILKVEYDKDTQVDEITNAIGAIYMQFIDNDSNFGEECANSAALLSAYLFAYKNPGFAEENEIRCVHLLDVERSGGVARLKDYGGAAGGTKVDGEEVKFRISGGGIVSYIDIPFDRQNIQPLISSVYVGPSNINSIDNISYLLASKDFHVPDIKNSETTFRV